MPQAQQDPGCQDGLPLRLHGYDLVHQLEQSIRVVLDLNVDVEFDMLVLRLMGQGGRR